jgi:hypothetical protein
MQENGGNKKGNIKIGQCIDKATSIINSHLTLLTLLT